MAQLTSPSPADETWARNLIRDLRYVTVDGCKLMIDCKEVDLGFEDLNYRTVYVSICATVRDVDTPEKKLDFITCEDISSACLERSEVAVLEAIWKLFDRLDNHERMERLRWRDGRPVWEPHHTDGRPITNRDAAWQTGRPAP